MRAPSELFPHFARDRAPCTSPRIFADIFPSSADGAGAAAEKGRSKFVILLVGALCLRDGIALLIPGDLLEDRLPERNAQVVREFEEQDRHVCNLAGNLLFPINRALMALLRRLPNEELQQLTGFRGNRDGELLWRVKLLPVPRIAEFANARRNAADGILGHAAASCATLLHPASPFVRTCQSSIPPQNPPPT